MPRYTLSSQTDTNAASQNEENKLASYLLIENGTTTSVSQTISLNGSQSRYIGFTTPQLRPKLLNWGQAALSVSFSVTTGNANINAFIYTYRVNNGGTTLASYTSATAVNCTSGTKTYNIPTGNLPWTSSTAVNATDRIQIRMYFANTVGSAQACTIALNVSASYLDYTHPIVTHLRPYQTEHVGNFVAVGGSTTTALHEVVDEVTLSTADYIRPNPDIITTTPSYFILLLTSFGTAAGTTQNSLRIRTVLERIVTTAAESTGEPEMIEQYRLPLSVRPPLPDNLSTTEDSAILTRTHWYDGPTALQNTPATYLVEFRQGSTVLVSQEFTSISPNAITTVELVVPRATLDAITNFYDLRLYIAMYLPA